ncbi:hypothetical protein [Mangrovicella endophytica]|uniref:hypothetical protein n=1 Tax=Mangrovicella endophytica TaxID=2066697 RepID=UPI000C9E6F4C|nr:hypothetical protein [Mangrovicella endophytica]
MTPAFDRAEGHTRWDLIPLAFVILFSVLYFLLYFHPMALHDATHYAISGVSLVRDHKFLTYPYGALSGGGTVPTYQALQFGSIVFDVRTNYPSKLLSLIYGIICTITGRMRLEYMQWISFGCFLIGNVLLYLLGRRFLNSWLAVLMFVIVNFLPVMRLRINPGSDGIGYTCFVILLWLLFCCGLRPLVLGATAGVLAHSRGQLVSAIFVLPLFYSRQGRSIFLHPTLPLFAGFVVTYFALGAAFNLLGHAVGGGSPVDFYIQYFAKTGLGLLDGARIATKLVVQFLALFDKNQMSILGMGLLLLAPFSTRGVERKLAVGAGILLLLPILTYGIDRNVNAQPRYFMPAVPLLVLFIFVSTQRMAVALDRPRAAQIIQIVLAVVTTALWFSTYTLPYERLKPAVIANQAAYLDFDGAEAALASTFRQDDVVLINHSLPTGLSKIHNIVLMPTHEQFMAGNNAQVDGLVFTYVKTPPNDFFAPKDWIVGDDLPQTIVDGKGLQFVRTFRGTSTLTQSPGVGRQEAFLQVYRKVAVAASPAL